MATSLGSVSVMEAEAQRRRSAFFVAALVLAAFFVAFGGLHYGFYTRKLLVDTPIYERYGDAIVHGHNLPYRDFAVEYPPGALPVFALPSLAAPARDFERYRQLFEALMLACGAAGSALVGFVLARQQASTARLVAGTLLAGLAPLALGPVVLSRFDLWPAALTIAALASLVADRRRLGFGLLGGAIAAKVYPAVLLPLALAFVWRRAGRREALICIATLVAVGAACILPFAIAAPHGVWASLSGQAGRPLQIESLGASFLLAAHQLWSLPLTEVASYGSDNLVGRLPDLLAAAQSLLAVVVLAAIWIAFARGPADRERLLRYSAAAVCAFVALDKVLSPQYLIWLIALVPLVRGRRGDLASLLFLAAAVLTQLWFPRHYIDLVYGLDPRASWLVLARDLVLVALLVTLVWPRRRNLLAGAWLVGVLVAGASAAAVTAAISGSGARGPMHLGLLAETGVASTCASPKRAPATSAGSVHYDASTFTNPGRRPRCVIVRLTTKPRLQLFGAAYLDRFDETDPRVGYLADAGICTNLEAATGPALTYSFTVPAGARFAIEVESCGVGSSASLPYTLDVRGGAPAAVASAAATRRGSGVVVRWHASPESERVTFTVYREQLAVKVPLDGSIALDRPHGAAYSITDPRPPEAVPFRYWIHAQTPNGGWSWYGPVVPHKS